ncbi:MAG: bifunctional phosphoglucose/phosphomannose isomerase [Candidatus Omnitrophica bacterium]|nr:bifunctional phosphoglucose/phosphomannose isomerase [Candidatus Omnitrophota bacterium]
MAISKNKTVPNLDSVEMISSIDKENMARLLTSFPEQCREALSIGERAELKDLAQKKYANIVFTGLGGSAIGADMVNGYLHKEMKLPLFVNRNYVLPGFVDAQSLVFAVSYSGNTEETLAAYEVALKRDATIIVITSGGKLEELASKNGNALITIPKGYPPRCALGYSFIPAIIALSKLGLAKDKKDIIKKAIDFLETLKTEKLAPEVANENNISKSIASKIFGTFSTIYASETLGSVATRWRGQLAENAKTLSSAHVFPEMNHNEIVGWVNPRKMLDNFTAIILKDVDDQPRIKKRMDITASILKNEGFSVLELESQGENFLERMLSLVYTGDFVSFYLSILNGIDPTPVERITYLKKRLAE